MEIDKYIQKYIHTYIHTLLGGDECYSKKKKRGRITGIVNAGYGANGCIWDYQRRSIWKDDS